MDNLDLNQHVTGPTHNRGNTLDLVISRGITVADLVVSDMNVSDRHCLSFNVSLNTMRNHFETIIKRRHLNTTAEVGFVELTNALDHFLLLFWS